MALVLGRASWFATEKNKTKTIPGHARWTSLIQLKYRFLTIPRKIIQSTEPIKMVRSMAFYSFFYLTNIYYLLCTKHCAGQWKRWKPNKNPNLNTYNRIQHNIHLLYYKDNNGTNSHSWYNGLEFMTHRSTRSYLGVTVTVSFWIFLQMRKQIQK